MNITTQLETLDTDFYDFAIHIINLTGSIAPETVEGKVCTIIYGFLFVPLTLVVIRDLGQMALVYITKFYAILLIKLRYFHLFYS